MTTMHLPLHDGVRLCTQTFGSPTDPSIVLIHGASSSMLWWDEKLCRQLASAGRHVIRFDQRDTGLSSTFPVGEPGYSDRDLASDVLGILDHIGLEHAHVLGCSMGGWIAGILGIDHPERVASLTLLSTTTGAPDLPPPVAALPEPGDLTDPGEQVRFMLASTSALDSVSSRFDRSATRRLIEADVARSHDLRASLVNPFQISSLGPGRGGWSDISAPTLVMHSDLDPLFPLPHGRALAQAVPGAELLVLADQGHDLLPHNWDAFSQALMLHTDR